VARDETEANAGGGIGPSWWVMELTKLVTHSGVAIVTERKWPNPNRIYQEYHDRNLQLSAIRVVNKDNDTDLVLLAYGVPIGIIKEIDGVPADGFTQTIVKTE